MAGENRPPGFPTTVLRHAFSWLLVRPLITLGLGLKVRHRERIPGRGPAILVANHNSHLDTLVLMSLLPYRLVPHIRPVAAADYFLANPILAWFSRTVIGIIPVERGGRSSERDPLAGIAAALQSDEIVIFFPEGTRGEPEAMAGLKSGIGHLARRFPEVPVIPVFLHGLGKTLPKGAWVPVPFFVDVVVGEAIFGIEDARGFVAELDRRLHELDGEIDHPDWT